MFFCSVQTIWISCLDNQSQWKKVPGQGCTLENKVDNAIHWVITIQQVGKFVFVNTYPLGGDFSGR